MMNKFVQARFKALMLRMAMLAGTSALTATVALTESAAITVKGMVCESCAESVTSKLKANPDIDSVVVNVKKGRVEVGLKDGATVKDETLGALIADAGYQVTAIERKS